MKLKFGERNIIHFKNEHEFYEAMGYLANNSRGIRIDWESYDNKWGIEGRIWIANATNLPDALKCASSAGTSIYDCRINCNEYLEILIREHNFSGGSKQDKDQIRNSIPLEYYSSFDDGYEV